MTADELIALNDQLAAMSRAGLPLDQGLAGLARDMERGRLRTVTKILVRDLHAGVPLPDAVARQENHLPPYYAALIQAGMRTGRIADVLATLSTYVRSLSVVRGIIIDSIFYPAVILTLGFSLFAAMAFFVLPQFEKVFDDFGMNLPWLTQFVLGFSHYRYLVLAAPAAVIMGFLLLRWTMRTTTEGSILWSRLLYAIPVIGTLMQSARLAAFTELLSVLIEYELPLSEAYRLAGEASPDPLTRARAREVVQCLNNGEPLGATLHGRGLVPQWVAWMTATGEQRGNLASSLRQIAAVYRQQVEGRAMLLRMVLPPFLIVTTAGILTTGFVLSLMLPIIKLLEGLSQ